MLENENTVGMGFVEDEVITVFQEPSGDVVGTVIKIVGAVAVACVAAVGIKFGVDYFKKKANKPSLEDNDNITFIPEDDDRFNEE